MDTMKEWVKITERCMQLHKEAMSSAAGLLKVSEQLGGLELEAETEFESIALRDKIILKAICEKIIDDKWEYQVEQTIRGELFIMLRFVK